MASPKPYKFDYGQQINQFNSKTYCAVIGTEDVASITVPELSNIKEGIIAVMKCRCENSTFVSVGWNSTPSLPTDTTFADDCGEIFDGFNLLEKRVTAGDELNFITSTDDTFINVVFYTAASF